MGKERASAHTRFEATHPVLQTRVPQEFYDRIKAEAAAQRMPLAKLLTRLFDDYKESVPVDLDSLKDQWKMDGWIECAGWLLAKFRSEGFCDMDLIRLTQWLQSDPEIWPKVHHAAKRHQEEDEAGPIEDAGQ